MSPDDLTLVRAAQAGDRAALEDLISRYQAWIYNVALRMVWQPEAARDVTQEVLIKIVTKLSTFRGEGSFRTWVYRITANHVLNMEKRGSELTVVSFEEYAARINACPDDVLPDPATVPVDPKILEGESKLACMTGMLLCLSREQRLVLVLGGILQLDAATGAEVLETTPENFRQKLSRARRDLLHFMNNQCGLVNPTNPCRCAKKTRAFINAGVVDPERLRFNQAHLRTVSQVVPQKARRLERWLALFQEHPFQDGPDLVSAIREALASREFQAATELDPLVRPLKGNGSP